MRTTKVSYKMTEQTKELLSSDNMGIDRLPYGTHLKHGAMSKGGGTWIASEYLYLDLIDGGYLRPTEIEYYSTTYAVLLFKYKPLLYMDIQGINPKSAEGKRLMAVWTARKMKGE